jgi:hypothetical protein
MLLSPISPIRGGTCLEITPLLVITLVIPIEVILELVTPSLVVSSGLEFLEFLFTTILLTPPQIGVGSKITLISNTPHASKVLTTPLMTFEETLNLLIEDYNKNMQYTSCIKGIHNTPNDL